MTLAERILATGAEIDEIADWLDHLDPGARIEQARALAADLDGAGNNLNNTIKGNSGANTLHGGGGSDIIYGYGGSDILIGGAGDEHRAPEQGTLLEPGATRPTATSCHGWRRSSETAVRRTARCVTETSARKSI